MVNNQSQQTKIRKTHLIFATTAIILLGTWLRLTDIGASPFMADQERISVLASQLGQDGDWKVLGPRMSVGSLKHSPLTIYLYGLPYLLDNTPHIARIFTALMNIIGIAVVHVIGSRYFGQITGIFAMFFLAISPVAVHHSRFIWNPNLAPPFVMLFFLCILLGYYDRKPLARIVHLPMLSLAGQCHPSLFLLAPLACLFWIHAYRFSTAARQRLITHTALSAVLALALMLPWVIGMYTHISTIDYLRSMNTGNIAGWQAVTRITFSALGGSFGSFAEDTSALPQLAILTLVVSAWLLIRGIFSKGGLPGLLIVLGFFTIPTFVAILGSQLVQEITAKLFLDKGIELNWWISTVIGCAALIQGVLIGGVARIRPSRLQPSWLWYWPSPLRSQYLRVPTILGLTIATIIVINAHIQFDYSYDTGLHSLYKGRNSLDDSTAALRYGQELALSRDQDLIVLASHPPLETANCIGCRNWEALMLIKEPYIRVIWDDYGLPLPKQGAVILSPFNYAKRPLALTNRELIYTWFSVASLPPAAHFKPDLPLLHPVQLSSGATILGFLREVPASTPVPGTTWKVNLLWRVDTPEPEHYKLFAHLVDRNGIKAQDDPPGMIPDGHNSGEHVLSPLDFQIDQDFPTSGPLYLRFGMYNHDIQASILNPQTSDADLVQIRGNEVPKAVMDNGLQLNELKSQSPLQQGTPLNVTATWYTAFEEIQTETLRLNWELESYDNVTVFTENTDLIQNGDIHKIAGNVFLTERYTLRIPTDLLEGHYKLSLTVSDRETRYPDLYFVDHLEITARARNFHPPRIQTELGFNTTFGNQIGLLGYDIAQDASTMNLVLHWLAITQLPIDYKYFVHIWQNNVIVAQADNMPGSYLYPTSWWAPGEIVSDHVTIDLSEVKPGNVRVTAGLYNPINGSRLPITDNRNIDTHATSINIGIVAVP